MSGATATEIKQGMRVRFMNGDVDPVIGIVNGAPWVFFDGIDAVARIPVFVPASGKCIDVGGHNIMSVGTPAEQFSVKA